MSNTALIFMRTIYKCMFLLVLELGQNETVKTPVFGRTYVSGIQKVLTNLRMENPLIIDFQKKANINLVLCSQSAR